jgi:hypothetical protein
VTDSFPEKDLKASSAETGGMNEDRRMIEHAMLNSDFQLRATLLPIKSFTKDFYSINILHYYLN